MLALKCQETLTNGGISSIYMAFKLAMTVQTIYHDAIGKRLIGPENRGFYSWSDIVEEILNCLVISFAEVNRTRASWRG